MKAIPPRHEELSSPREIIERLGGVHAVAELFDVDPKVVWNWRVMEQLPARTYVLFQQALNSAGLRAPNGLWTMVLPVERDTESVR